ncbi:MAG: GTP-binding protein, partial [Pseudomonadota bacterium]
DDMLDHDTPLSELFEDQMACADMVVVNKADLLGDGPAEALAQELRKRSRIGVQVLKARMGAVDPAVLLGLGVGAEDHMDVRGEVHHHHHHDDHDDDHHSDDHHEHHHHHEHGHDAFESFVVTLPALSDPEAFVSRISAVIAAQGILRLKGFAAVSGKPMRLVIQAVGPRVDTHFDRPFAADEAQETRLVVIGEAGLDQAAIRAALEEGLDLAA